MGENEMKKVQFAVWDSEDGDSGYWCLYDTIEDAVSDKGDGCEVYRAEFKPFGKFKRAVKVVKIKRRRKRK